MKDKNILPARLISGLSEKEKAFCLCLICGMSGAQSFRICINPQVSNASAASMACRLLAEPRIQQFCWTLYRNRSRFVFNESCLKSF